MGTVCPPVYPWFELPVLGCWYKIVLVSKEHPVLASEGLLGLCDSDQKVIFLSYEQDNDSLIESLFHELLHGLFANSGFRDTLVHFLADGTKIQGVEETLIRILSPCLHHTFTVGNLLKNLPKKPRLPK